MSQSGRRRKKSNYGVFGKGMTDVRCLTGVDLVRRRGNMTLSGKTVSCSVKLVGILYGLLPYMGFR